MMARKGIGEKMMRCSWVKRNSMIKKGIRQHVIIKQLPGHLSDTPISSVKE